MNPFPVIVSSPSGGGKTTIMRRILEMRPDVGYSISCTTRMPRAGEVDGRDYIFLSTGEFLAARDRGEFAEWAEVHGKLYGTRRREIEQILGSGRHVLLDIDVQGAKQILAAFPLAVSIFVVPPSAGVLVTRLTARKTENRATLATRLRAAVEELQSIDVYHYVVVNDHLEQAIRRVSAVLDAEAVRRQRQPKLDDLISTMIAELQKDMER